MASASSLRPQATVAGPAAPAAVPYGRPYGRAAPKWGVPGGAFGTIRGDTGVRKTGAARARCLIVGLA
ncbi:hypothetical protein GCM10010259_61300 [Streptomyces daghestanicus]|nr:hypothetical protein GCM10010259_61300 [Streptomyces daghestanicus]